VTRAEGEWLCAGRIAGAYGIKGWVKVHSYTDPPQNLCGMQPLRLRGAQLDRDIEFAEWRPQGKGLVARIEGVDDRDAAQALRGLEIYVPAADLPALDEGEYYWRELLGLRVYCDFEGSELLLGEVKRLLETGANDVLLLRPCEGSIDQRERLLPWLPGDVVESVDVQGGRMTVHWHPED